MFLKMMESIRLEGDISDKELLTRRDKIDDDRCPLPENWMLVVQGAENECHFLKYGDIMDCIIEELQQVDKTLNQNYT